MWPWKNEPKATPAAPAAPAEPAAPAHQETHQELTPEATQALRRAAKPDLGEAIQKIGVEDFKQANKIPCMRSAMLTGAGIGAVSGGVMALAKRPLPKAANWAVIGFFLGAVFSWEQCRFRRRQGKLNVVNAREAYSKK